MDRPENISLKDICNEIEAVSFNVKMRGYAPEEVDAFMDSIVERLHQVEEKLEEMRRYETWLRVDVHQQVVDKAQQEARQIMQAAQDRSRALLENTSGELSRKQEEMNASLRQYTASWKEQKSALESELSELKAQIKTYRRRVMQDMEETMTLLRQDQQREEEEVPRHRLPEVSGLDTFLHTDPLRPTVPRHSDSDIQLQTNEDIDKMLDEIRRQVTGV